MEDSIITLGQTLASFCNGVESSCHALSQSLDRHSIPLDSASATFMQSLNRRVSSLSGELNLLETMSFGTVSFEELLGHCNQVYKNQADLVDLTDRLRYADCNLSSYDAFEDASLNLPDSYPGSVLKEFEDDSFCYEKRPHHYNDNHPNSKTILDETDGVIEGDSSSTISISEDDYEGLPSYMKSLVSWEDMQIATDKINSRIQNKSNTNERGYFHADELASMGLGPKGMSYLLMLVRMKKLVIETKDGSIFYKVA